MSLQAWFISLAIALALCSCNCSCDCERKPGERIFRAYTEDGDSLLEEISLTYLRHVNWESTHRNRIEEFINLHRNDSIQEEVSIWSEEKDHDLSCRKGLEHSTEVWVCHCYK